MSYVLVFSLQLKDQILYCTVTVLVLPANMPQTLPFGNFNFRVMVFTVNASWQHRRLMDAAHEAGLYEIVGLSETINISAESQ